MSAFGVEIFVEDFSVLGPFGPQEGLLGLVSC
jgi:hypothetical protein